MKFIDKRNKKSRKKGHTLIKSFIRSCWNERKDLTYKNFRNFDYHEQGNRFKSLLMKEQGFRCCYCMRYLSNADMANLEHVIPQSIEKEDIKSYFKYGCLKPKWIFNGKGMDMTKQLHTPPYPHFIAYENLVASCYGTIDPNAPRANHCCNNKRGNQQIIPVFYLNNASNLIEYDNNGLACSSFKKSKETIKAINLNHPTLKLMRKAWAKLSSEYSLFDIKTAIGNDVLRKDIVDDMELDIQSEEPTLKKEPYWKLFWEYRWFYSYFCEK